MKIIHLAVTLLLTPAAFAVTPVNEAPEDPASLQDEAQALETRLSALKEELRELNRKYPDRDGMPEGVQNELLEIAHEHDRVERALEYRRLAIVGYEARFGNRGLASERRPATGIAYEHPNGGCRFASDMIEQVSGTRPNWNAEGRPVLPRAAVLNERNEGAEQSITVLGNAMAISSHKGKKARTHIHLKYGAGNRLTELQLAEKNMAKSWTQTVSYDWSGDNCTVRRVTQTGPDIPGKVGVSFDAGLCRALDAKGLLDDKRIFECQQFNENVGATVEAFAKDLAKNQAFILFTTGPTGTVKLKEWNRRDHLAVNANIANDCNFYFNRPRGLPFQPGEGPNAGTVDPGNGTSAQ